MKAYHFTGKTLRDGRPIPKIGEKLVHEGPIVPCRSGLHASIRVIDALCYAPGNIVHIVELDGDVVHHKDDKIVGRERTILASIDATEILLKFRRWAALKALEMIENPDPIIKYYLETGYASDAAAAAADAWYTASAARSAAAAWYAANAWYTAAAAAAARFAAEAARSAADAARRAVEAADAARRAVGYAARRSAAADEQNSYLESAILSRLGMSKYKLNK